MSAFGYCCDIEIRVASTVLDMESLGWWEGAEEGVTTFNLELKHS